MNTVIALGATHALHGFALAGVTVVVATTEAEVTRAWSDLGAEVGLVIMSEAAAGILRGQLDDRPDVLIAVMP
jgi:vacuolar-type H+-ATPase subunit F/Vma7